MTVMSTPAATKLTPDYCLLVLQRHTRHCWRMIVLQATQDIRKVSLWLGHSNLTTTEVYVPTEKLEAIEAVVPPSLRKGKFRPPDKLLVVPCKNKRYMLKSLDESSSGQS